MKAYIITTGVIFGLITVAHLWRMVTEGSRLLTEPEYLVLTAMAAGLSLWAARLVWRSPNR